MRQSVFCSSMTVSQDFYVLLSLSLQLVNIMLGWVVFYRYKFWRTFFKLINKCC